MNGKNNLTSRWIWTADREFSLASEISSSFPEIAAFHYHEAAEKYLRAYLSHRQAPFKKTHNIGTLTLMACRLDAEFAKLVMVADVDVISGYGDLFMDPGVEEIDFPKAEELDAAKAFCVAAKRMVLERVGVNLSP